MADTPFNLLELPGVFEPGVYASVVYDSDPGLAAHRIGFALVRVWTPYPSFRMATQIGNIAQILDGAIDFYNKSPQEQGEALGKATVSVASDVAIAALTDGLGSVAGLRKAEKALEAADHVKDASKAAGATTTVLSDVTVVSKGKIVGQGNVYLRPTIEKIESGGLRPRDTFTNREGLLPPRPAGYYKEYVHPTEGISGPGSQRIVRGAGGEMYYTPDHYKTFVPLHGSSSR